MKKFIARINRDNDCLSPHILTFSARDDIAAIRVVEQELLDWTDDHITYEIYQLPRRSFKRNKPEIQFPSTHGFKGSYPPLSCKDWGCKKYIDKEKIPIKY